LFRRVERLKPFFKIEHFIFSRGGRRKFYRGSIVVVQQWGGALALYTQLWQLKGVSDADGFAALAADSGDRRHSIGDGSGEAATMKFLHKIGDDRILIANYLQQRR